MSRGERQGAAGLRDELDRHIMPGQMRALEQVATRFMEERPSPEASFRASLDQRVGELAAQIRGRGPAHWRLGGALLLLSGLALLGLAAILAVQLGTAG